MENGRIKQKVKTLQETVLQLTGTTKENGANGASEADLDYDDLGRDFLLVGGVRDPLSLRYEVAIRDLDNIEHKSAERYYWYKMAEKFGDNEAKTKILQAPNVGAAEAAMKEIKNFDEEVWNKVFFFTKLFISQKVILGFMLLEIFYFKLIRQHVFNCFNDALI